MEPLRRPDLVALLAGAGCVAAEEEADEMLAAAAGDAARLRGMAARRIEGEPLAWITGTVVFAGLAVAVHPGVYVPRAQSEVLVERAVDLLPPAGTAVDLCTGSGAVAAAISATRPAARVVGTDADPVAGRCAAANGVDVHVGNLADPLPRALRGSVDVVTAVVPYVPTEAMQFLPRDVREHEPERALDGGPGGTVLLRRAVLAAAALLRPGGALVLELGGDQDTALAPTLRAAGFGPVRRHVDDDGDLRAVEARLLRPPPGRSVTPGRRSGPGLR